MRNSRTQYSQEICLLSAVAFAAASVFVLISVSTISWNPPLFCTAIALRRGVHAAGTAAAARGASAVAAARRAVGKCIVRPSALFRWARTRTRVEGIFRIRQAVLEGTNEATVPGRSACVALMEWGWGWNYIKLALLDRDIRDVWKQEGRIGSNDMASLLIPCASVLLQFILSPPPPPYITGKTSPRAT